MLKLRKSTQFGRLEFVVPGAWIRPPDQQRGRIVYKASVSRFGVFATESAVFALMGYIWLANAVLLGRSIYPDTANHGCAAGIQDFVAFRWLTFAGIGFVGSLPLVATFGFLSSWLTEGKRSPYALVFFVAPLFCLVSQNVAWTSESIRYFGESYWPFALATSVLAVVFLPGFYFHSYLKSRCAGRQWACSLAHDGRSQQSREQQQ